jgi:hypothetical protein
MNQYMKSKTLVSLASVLCSSIAFAADAGSGSKQLELYPKNLARQHVGSNLFIFNTASQTFVPTEAAAAWLDDDVSTGWPIMAGTQHYLLALSEPELLTNFSLSTRPTAGTVTIYAGDEPAPPSAKSWSVVGRDIPLEAINEKKIARPFNKLAKYVLIETNIADPGPMFSLYVYGGKAAVSYDLRSREQAIDTTRIFGQHVNNQTTFNLDGLYAKGRVDYANSPDGYFAWQKAIDDNPETSLKVLPSTNEAGAVVHFDGSHTISRVSLLTNQNAKGKLDIYALPEAAAADAGKPVSVEGMTPTVSMIFDGSNARSNMDFPAVSAAAIAVRWTPVSPSDALALREINSFGGMTLASYEVSLSPAAVAAYDAAAEENGYRNGGSGKEVLGPDGKDAKEVALGPPSPYLPGALGFPPNLDNRRIPPPPALSE